MLQLIRTNSDNPDFQKLVTELDKELKIRDGEDHPFYDQFNKIDAIRFVVVAYSGSAPVGCGAIKKFDHQTMEIKRMFVLKNQRGQGIATAILKMLEEWSREMKVQKCILETGINQPEAISLYKQTGYSIIPNYAQYAGVETSLCFEKIL